VESHRVVLNEADERVSLVLKKTLYALDDVRL